MKFFLTFHFSFLITIHSLLNLIVDLLSFYFKLPLYHYRLSLLLLLGWNWRSRRCSLFEINLIIHFIWTKLFILMAIGSRSKVRELWRLLLKIINMFSRRICLNKPNLSLTLHYILNSALFELTLNIKNHINNALPHLSLNLYPLYRSIPWIFSRKSTSFLDVLQKFIQIHYLHQCSK